MATKAPQEFSFYVIFEERDDGGLRARSPELPNFLLSHSNRDSVLKDVVPALEILLSEMYGQQMKVRHVPGISEALDHQIPLPHICAPLVYLGETVRH